MNVDKTIAERERLEAIVDNCKFEKPEQVAELFEAYSHLIWKYHQVGRIYDYYYDNMIIHREGGDDLVGLDKVVEDTLAYMAAFPDTEFIFKDIWCVGNPEDGFRFGQSVYFKGTHTGPGKYGPGNGEAFEAHEMIDLCQCNLQFVDGRWRVVEEWGSRSTEAMDRLMKRGREEEFDFDFDCDCGCCDDMDDMPMEEMCCCGDDAE